MAEPQAKLPAMAGYGVDPATWDPLPWSWARERLDRGRNYWLGTVSADGRPHSMPVWAVWHDGDTQLAFSCAPTARKARNLADNPRVVVTGADAVECISLEGAAAPLDGDRAEVWIERYLAKYSPLEPSLDAPFLRRNLLFEMTPERAFGVIESPDEFSTRATRWVFER